LQKTATPRARTALCPGSQPFSGQRRMRICGVHAQVRGAYSFNARIVQKRVGGRFRAGRRLKGLSPGLRTASARTKYSILAQSGRRDASRTSQNYDGSCSLHFARSKQGAAIGLFSFREPPSFGFGWVDERRDEKRERRCQRCKAANCAATNYTEMLRRVWGVSIYNATSLRRCFQCQIISFVTEDCAVKTLQTSIVGPPENINVF
jgi:hypothetical protein